MPVTKEKTIKDLKKGEEVYFADYRLPFIVKSIDKTGTPIAILKNEITELKLKGNMIVRSTKLIGK